jgi:hypothetical protein
MSLWEKKTHHTQQVQTSQWLGPPTAMIDTKPVPMSCPQIAKSQWPARTLRCHQTRVNFPANQTSDDIGWYLKKMSPKQDMCCWMVEPIPLLSRIAMDISSEASQVVKGMSSHHAAQLR